MDNFQGYTVEKVEGMKLIAYKLHGPRGTYTLMRRVSQPEVMFVFNSKGKVASIGNISLVTDRKGYLEAVHNGQW